MKGIVTAVGKDKVGIIARICSHLSARDVNILDISQTIVQGYFNMIMVLDFSDATQPFEAMVEELAALGQEIGISVKLQSEDIFNAMHRI